MVIAAVILCAALAGSFLLVRAIFRHMEPFDEYQERDI